MVEYTVTSIAAPWDGRYRRRLDEVTGDIMAKKKSGRTAAAPLKAVVFVACDSVSRDPNTGKPTLYGLFDIVWASEFPCRSKSFALYAKLTGEGKHPISIHLVGPGGQTEKLGEADIKIAAKAMGHVQAELVGVEFKRPGTYELLLRAGRRTVGRTSFQVRRKVPDKRKK